MTILSTTAVSYLVERLVRQHERIDLDALVLLLAALDIPAPRAHAGIERAIDRGSISLVRDEGRQVLVVADPRTEAGHRRVGVQPATDTRADVQLVRQGGLEESFGATTGSPALLVARRTRSESFSGRSGGRGRV